MRSFSDCRPPLRSTVSYALSRLRFKMRKPMMNIALILGMFPGFMSMVAIYYILKGLGLTENPLVCLTLVYICGSGLTYYIAKGFFDTIPKSLDESAYLDGATRSQVFIICSLLSLITFRRSASYKNEEAFQ